MAVKKFGIAELQNLDDGRVALQIDKLIRAATDDCMNRPGVEGARKITITMTMNPIQDEGGVCEEVAVEVQSKLGTPSMCSKTFSMGTNAAQGLLYNDASNQNIHQQTLDDAENGIDGNPV